MAYSEELNFRHVKHVYRAIYSLYRYLVLHPLDHWVNLSLPVRLLPVLLGSALYKTLDTCCHLDFNTSEMSPQKEAQNECPVHIFLFSASPPNPIGTRAAVLQQAKPSAEWTVHRRLQGMIGGPIQRGRSQRGICYPPVPKTRACHIVHRRHTLLSPPTMISLVNSRHSSLPPRVPSRSRVQRGLGP